MLDGLDIRMNEGAGLNKNIPTKSIYAEAVKKCFEMNSDVQRRGLAAVHCT